MLVDEAVITVRSGRGGNGVVAFRREKYVPKGGPAGGDGGKGGDVIIATDPQLSTLIDFRYETIYTAQNGKPGSGAHKTGAAGADRVIYVPVGTLVYDDQTGVLLADLNAPGLKLLVARGGRGGRGNAHFATPSHQAPDFAEGGAPGEERRLRLELRLMADVGIIGLPNVGKSTLVSVVSAARPKIADYPFTTLVPNLGMVRLPGVGRSFVIADMPGLIAGAHSGAGLGDRFLRHISRTRLLIHMLDAASTDGRDPLTDFNIVNRELELYGQGLEEIPQIVALNKIDLPDAERKAQQAARVLQARGYDCHCISAVTGQGVMNLMESTWARLAKLTPVSTTPTHEQLLVAAPPPEKPLAIVRDEKGAFRVTGTAAEHAAATAYLQSPEGLARFHRALRNLGVLDALRDAGAQEGDTVFIGQREFQYCEEDDTVTPRRHNVRPNRPSRRRITP